MCRKRVVVALQVFVLLEIVSLVVATHDRDECPTYDRPNREKKDKYQTNNYDYCIGVANFKSTGSHLFEEAARNPYPPGGFKDFIRGTPYDTGNYIQCGEFNDRDAKIQVFGIEVDGKALRGWFHVRFTIVFNQPVPLRSFILFGADDENWNYGEFVSDFPKCTEPQDFKEKQDSPQWMYLPCAGASQVEQSLPWGVIYIAQPKQIFEYLVPKRMDLYRNEFSFNFRLPTTPCNQPKGFYFKGMYISSSSNLQYYPKTADSFLITLQDSEYIGAPDPIPREGTYDSIKCDGDLTKMNLTYTRDRKNYVQTAACPNSEGSFSGRCIEKSVHTCRNDFKTQRTLVKYSEHLKAMRPNDDKCKPCGKMPPRPKTTTSKTNKPKPAKSVSNEKKGIPLSNVAALELWDTRVIHGIAMTIASIFLIPVNIFFTRYFKETFMKKRIFQHRLWFFFHHLLTAFTLVFYAIGLTRMIKLRSIVGVNMSTNRKYHMRLGWFSVVAMVLMTFLGGFRCTNRSSRAIGISAHWTIGMAIHFANYAVIKLSVWIAGSPSAFDDVTNKKGKFQYFALVGGVWILVDVLFHVAMTILQVIKDKKLNLRKHRIYLPSMIPVAREHWTVDVPGSKIRKRMLALYISLSLLFTIGLCGMIYTQDPSGRGLGQMSCTHSRAGSILPKGTRTTCSR